MLENNASNKIVKIANVKIEENKEGTSDIIVKLDDYSKNARVHVVANQF